MPMFQVQQSVAGQADNLDTYTATQISYMRMRHLSYKHEFLRCFYIWAD